MSNDELIDWIEKRQATLQALADGVDMEADEDAYQFYSGKLQAYSDVLVHIRDSKTAKKRKF